MVGEKGERVWWWWVNIEKYVVGFCVYWEFVSCDFSLWILINFGLFLLVWFIDVVVWILFGSFDGKILLFNWFVVGVSLKWEGYKV